LFNCLTVAQHFLLHLPNGPYGVPICFAENSSKVHDQLDVPDSMPYKYKI